MSVAAAWRTQIRRPFAMVVLAVSAIALVGTAPALASPPPLPIPSTSSVREAQDYASTAWADPWDYGNAEDMNLEPGFQTANPYNLAMANGLLSMEVASGSAFQPVNNFTGGYGYPRMGTTRPIDAGYYTEISFSMYSSNTSPQNGGVFWWGCDFSTPCIGAQSFTLKPGWNIYQFHLAPNLLNVPWSGLIHQLRVVPTGDTSTYVHVDVDWVRLTHQSGSAVTLALSGSPSEVWWTQENQATATPSRLRGRLPVIGSSATFPSDAFPPGSYRFFTVRNGEASALSAPITITGRPEPVVLSPDLAGGDDWATLNRGGNAWDMNELSDLSDSHNVSLIQGGGMICAVGTGVKNDPVVVFNTNGQTIDASAFHRLTYRIYYDSPFGLEDAPGGGMVSRVMWLTAPGGRTEISQDIVMSPGWQTVSIDLKTNPPSGIDDETMPNPVGWGGPQSSTAFQLRLDPHEDPAGRKFCIDDVRLTRNDGGAQSFGIQFQDRMWKAGTTATIQVSPSIDGAGATTIASGVAVTAGVNTYTWNGSGVSNPAAGPWYVKVIMTDGAGSTAQDVSMGTVDMVVPPKSPFGVVDSVVATGGGALVAGWAVDPDQGVNQPLQVRAQVDGSSSTTASTTVARSDVEAAFPGHGSMLGYSFWVGVPGGVHTVCLTAINTGAGTDSSLGCRSVRAGGDPYGSFDVLAASAPGQISVQGWAIDPDYVAASPAHIYVDGVGTAISANGPRADIGRAFPGYGPDHGFSFTKVVGGGTHQVCVYAYNAAPDPSPLLGCRSISLDYQPFGNLDQAIRSGANGTTLTVEGWAIDPDTNGPTQAHIYVAGVGTGFVANQPRADLAAAFPFYGGSHAFSGSITIPPGPQEVCMFAINSTAPGSNALLTCRRI